MKLIKLTDQDGEILYLNPTKITLIQPEKEIEAINSEVIIEGQSIHVQETPDEIALQIMPPAKPKSGKMLLLPPWINQFAEFGVAFPRPDEPALPLAEIHKKST